MFIFLFVTLKAINIDFISLYNKENVRDLQCNRKMKPSEVKIVVVWLTLSKLVSLVSTQVNDDIDEDHLQMFANCGSFPQKKALKLYYSHYFKANFRLLVR